MATEDMKTSATDQLTFVQKKAGEVEDEQFDKPKWSPEMSYRGNQYRYLTHQSNVMGYVKVKLLSAKNLKRRDWSYLGSVPGASKIGLAKGSEISPYMEFSVGGATKSSSVVANTSNPSWRRESFTIPLRKGTFEDGMPVILKVRGMESQAVLESVLPTAVKGDKSLGNGGVDITDLCMGLKDIVDTTINLDPSGEVHCLVAYESHGIEPAIGDVVVMEAYARKKSNLILDPDAPMKVLTVNGNYLHAQYRMPTERFGAVKIHRNSVFVVERLNFIDGIWNLAMKPSDIVLSTKAGHKATKIAKPYVAYVGELAKPAVFSAQLAIGAVKASVNAGLSGASAAGGSILGTKSPAKL